MFIYLESTIEYVMGPWRTGRHGKEHTQAFSTNWQYRRNKWGVGNESATVRDSFDQYRSRYSIDIQPRLIGWTGEGVTTYFRFRENLVLTWRQWHTLEKAILQFRNPFQFVKIVNSISRNSTSILSVQLSGIQYNKQSIERFFEASLFPDIFCVRFSAFFKSF